jgi:nickel-dependent lactate racemase
LTARYGAGEIRLDPAPFRLDPIEPQPDAAGPTLEAALDAPDGSPRLEEIVRQGQRVLLVVSDATRESAAAEVVVALLARLASAGVRPDAVRAAIATGLHSPPDEAGYRALLGPAASTLRRAATPPWLEGDFVDHGVTSRGTPVRLHRALSEADHVVLTGAIGFHYYAGFTGGRKSILPGLAAGASIAANHLLALSGPGGGRHAAATAATLDGNPVHLDMMEAAARRAPSFLVNTVVGADRRLRAAFAGDWVRAHRAGCAWLLQRRTVPHAGPRPFALVSAGGSPHDVDLVQSHKAIEAAFPLVAAGGAMVVLAECPRGGGHPQMEAWLDGRSAAEIRAQLARRYEVYGQTAHALRTKAEQVRIWFVSSLPPALVERAGMLPARSAADAVHAAERHLGGGTQGYFVPRGAACLPRPSFELTREGAGS